MGLFVTAHSRELLASRALQIESLGREKRKLAATTSPTRGEAGTKSSYCVLYSALRCMATRKPLQRKDVGGTIPAKNGEGGDENGAEWLGQCGGRD